MFDAKITVMPFMVPQHVLSQSLKTIVTLWGMTALSTTLRYVISSHTFITCNGIEIGNRSRMEMPLTPESHGTASFRQNLDYLNAYID